MSDGKIIPIIDAEIQKWIERLTRMEDFIDDYLADVEEKIQQLEQRIAKLEEIGLREGATPLTSA